MTISTFLSQLCEHCGLAQEDVKIEELAQDNEIILNLEIPEEDSGIFIGHHGEGIDSIQRLIRIIFQNSEEKELDKKITLNINQYRDKRVDRLKDLTYSLGNKVLQTGNPHTFDSFLPAHERYIVHSTISQEEGFKDLESVSSGEGRNRKLTIQLKKQN